MVIKNALKKYILLLTTLFVSQLTLSQYSEYDWVERDTWMNVKDIFAQAGIDDGSFVADIGCHEGYLSVHLAKAVGYEGSVFAVDVRLDRLETLKSNLKDRNLTNVNVIHGDYDDPKLPKNELDVVIIMDTYHEMYDYMTILRHVHTSLKPEGRIVIIEKLKTHLKGKSRAAQIDAHSLGSTYVKNELIDAGFKIVHQDNDMGDWENDTNKVIWMLIAEKPKTN